MLNDLTPEEVVALAQIVINIPDGTMVFVGDVLTKIEDAPGAITLAEKINQAGEREDVKKYIKERYENNERNHTHPN